MSQPNIKTDSLACWLSFLYPFSIDNTELAIISIGSTDNGIGTRRHHSQYPKIYNAGKHLLTLINHILDLSKIEAGRTELYL
jgi:signal transduction histidine kinase